MKQMYARGDTDSIPYDKQVEGLAVPGEGTIAGASYIFECEMSGEGDDQNLESVAPSEPADGGSQGQLGDFASRALVGLTTTFARASVDGSYGPDATFDVPPPPNGFVRSAPWTTRVAGGPPYKPRAHGLGLNAQTLAGAASLGAEAAADAQSRGNISDVCVVVGISESDAEKSIPEGYTRVDGGVNLSRVPVAAVEEESEGGRMIEEKVSEGHKSCARLFKLWKTVSGGGDAVSVDDVSHLCEALNGQVCLCSV